MEKQKIYDIIIKNLPIGYSVMNKSGIIVEFNQAAEKITEYSKTDVIGKSHIEFLHGTPDKDACPLFKHTLKLHEETVATETSIKKKNGELITIAVTGFPLINSDGIFMGGVELFNDITESKRLQREQKNILILSMFAHDMKNPIVTAGGFLYRLLSGKAEALAEKQLYYIELIQGKLNILENMITNFLEFSRLELNEYQLVLSSFDIERVIEKHIEASKIEADKKNVKITFEYPENISTIINADATMITRLITNLLDNAMKYTNPGGTIRIRLSDSDKDILVEVIDTGIGISEDHLPYIFDAFYRISRNSGGSGLGLSITKSIVEAHGGKIWVESAPQKGTIFSVIIPKYEKRNANKYTVNVI